MLPELTSTSDNITMINNFLGVNRTHSVSENEFADSKNITNDYYPVLGNRKRRGMLTQLTNVKAMLGGEVVSYVSGTSLYYNEQLVTSVLGHDNTSLVMMGAYLCVFPDGLIYNTSNGSIDYISKERTTGTTVTFSRSTADGAAFEGVVKSDSAPSSPSDGTYWYDTENKVLKVYSSSYSMWQAVATAFTKIQATGIGADLKQYDAVAINGLINDRESNTSKSGAHYIIYSCDTNYIVIAGELSESITAGSQSSSLVIKRDMPDLDFVCEMDNRLWGVSKMGHEVFCCKQGDPTNWYCYQGLVSDSYAASVGTQGEFTGCASYNGNVYFFKESGYHKIYGSMPSNYELTWKNGRGVQLDSHRSISHVGDYLFYKAKDAVVLFNGTSNVISEKLGTEKYFDAVGSGYRDKYYISMRDADYNYYLFIYDTTKNTWIIEEDIRVSFMADTNKNGLYLCKYPNSSGVSEVWTVNDEKIYVSIFPMKIYKDNTIYAGIEEELRYYLVNRNGVNQHHTIAQAASTFGYTEEEMKNFIGSRAYYPAADETDYTWYPGYVKKDAALEDHIDWFFETGDIGMDSPFKKYIKRIIVRMLLENQTNMKIEVMYDDTDYWQVLCDYHCTRKQSFELPLPVQRCDHLRLRFSGNGNFKLYSIAKATEEGSGL